MDNKINSTKFKVFFISAILLGILAVLFITVNGIYSYITDSIKLPLRITASFLIAAASVVIRFFLINKNKFVKRIHLSDPSGLKKLKPEKFINFIFISMIIGLSATVTIHIEFYLGAFLYFLMHTAVIISFSGIIYINPFKLKNSMKLFISQLMIYIFLIPLCLSIFFIINYKELKDLIFLPYLIVLIFTFALSVIGLFYNKGMLLFRIFIFTGCFIFMISDFLIGYVGNNNRDSLLIYFIGPTYIAAIFLLTFSQIVSFEYIKCN